MTSLRSLDNYSRNGERINKTGIQKGAIVSVDSRNRQYVGTFNNLPWRLNSLDSMQVEQFGSKRRPHKTFPGEIIAGGKYRKLNSRYLVEMERGGGIRPRDFEQITSYVTRVFNKAGDGTPLNPLQFDPNKVIGGTVTASDGKTQRPTGWFYSTPNIEYPEFKAPEEKDNGSAPPRTSVPGTGTGVPSDGGGIRETLRNIPEAFRQGWRNAYANRTPVNPVHSAVDAAVGQEIAQEQEIMGNADMLPEQTVYTGNITVDNGTIPVYQTEQTNDVLNSKETKVSARGSTKTDVAPILEPGLGINQMDFSGVPRNYTAELAQKQLNIQTMFMCGYLDGVNQDYFREIVNGALDADQFVDNHRTYYTPNGTSILISPIDAEDRTTYYRDMFFKDISKMTADDRGQSAMAFTAGYVLNSKDGYQVLQDLAERHLLPEDAASFIKEMQSLSDTYGATGELDERSRGELMVEIMAFLAANFDTAILAVMEHLDAEHLQQVASLVGNDWDTFSNLAVGTTSKSIPISHIDAREQAIFESYSSKGESDMPPAEDKARRGSAKDFIDKLKGKESDALLDEAYAFALAAGLPKEELDAIVKDLMTNKQDSAIAKLKPAMPEKTATDLSKFWKALHKNAPSVETVAIFASVLAMAAGVRLPQYRRVVKELAATTMFGEAVKRDLLSHTFGQLGNAATAIGGSLTVAYTGLTDYVSIAPLKAMNASCWRSIYEFTTPNLKAMEKTIDSLISTDVAGITEVATALKKDLMVAGYNTDNLDATQTKAYLAMLAYHLEGAAKYGVDNPDFIHSLVDKQIRNDEMYFAPLPIKLEDNAIFNRHDSVLTMVYNGQGPPVYNMDDIIASGRKYALVKGTDKSLVGYVTFDKQAEGSGFVYAVDRTSFDGSDFDVFKDATDLRLVLPIDLYEKGIVADPGKALTDFENLAKLRGWSLGYKRSSRYDVPGTFGVFYYPDGGPEHLVFDEGAKGYENRIESMFVQERGADLLQSVVNYAPGTSRQDISRNVEAAHKELFNLLKISPSVPVSDVSEKFTELIEAAEDLPLTGVEAFESRADKFNNYIKRVVANEVAGRIFGAAVGAMVQQMRNRN